MGLGRGRLLARLVVGIAFMCTPAFAQSASQVPVDAAENTNADHYFQEGLKAVQKQDYEAARVAFARSYEIFADVEVLRNLAVAEIKTGRLVEGARHLALYLATAQGLDQQQSDALRKLLNATEQKLGRLSFSSNVSDAIVFVDGTKLGDSERPYHVNPGEHDVRAEAAGYKPYSARRHVGVGELAEISFDLIPATSSASLGNKPAPSSDTTVQKRDEQRTTFINRTTVVIGLGVLTLGSAVAWYGFARAGSSAEERARELRRREQSSPAPCAQQITDNCRNLGDEVDAASRNYTIANVAQVMTFAFAIGTATTYVLWKDSKSQGTNATRPTAWIGPTGGGVNVTGAF